MKVYIRLKVDSIILNEQPVIKKNLKFLKDLLESDDIFFQENGDHGLTQSNVQIWIEVEPIPHPISPRDSKIVKMLSEYVRYRYARNSKIEFQPEQIEEIKAFF